MRILVLAEQGNRRPSRLHGGWLLLAATLATNVAADSPPRFPTGSVWHQRVDSAALHPDSVSMLNTLAALDGGWGLGGDFQIDFSFHVRKLTPGENPPTYPVVQRKGNAAPYYLPDCEPLGTQMPVPADAQFEGQPGLTCNNLGGDCHLIVHDDNLLYELYAGNLSGGELDALCLAVWDLNVVYPPEGRGDHCTSADAAGFPIAPLLFNADEVAAAVAEGNDSDLGHAIRFILPNSHMANDVSLGGSNGRLYVRPATHAGGPSGPVGSVPYGVRMRLKASFNMDAYGAAAQAILRTMQRYGIVLADGGNVALTAQSDEDTTAKWDTMDIDSHSLFGVQVTDFEVIDTGPRIPETYDCVRSSVVPGQGLFADGFED
ncbi:MAG: hypothetical protein R3F22_04925 [Lysobacteraceae bacterium]